MRAVNKQDALELALKACCRTHTHTQPPPHTLPLLSSLLALYGSAAHQQLLESVAFQSRAEEGRAGGVALCGPSGAERESSLSLPQLMLSIFLFLSSPPPHLISRAASRAAAKLLLSCHSGTDDKAGIFTGRRDPGYNTHTYGRQE